MTHCDFSARSARDEMRHIVGSSALSVAHAIVVEYPYRLHKPNPEALAPTALCDHCGPRYLRLWLWSLALPTQASCRQSWALPQREVQHDPHHRPCCSVLGLHYLYHTCKICVHTRTDHDVIPLNFSQLPLLVRPRSFHKAPVRDRRFHPNSSTFCLTISLLETR